MAGEYVSQYVGMLSDWSVSAFIAASMDWLFGFHAVDSHLLNLFSAILQLTFTTFLVHETTYALGLRRPSNTIQSTWITYFAVWQMSPKAVAKLSGAYYFFHRLLYGTASTEPATPPPEDPPTEEKRAK